MAKLCFSIANPTPPAPIFPTWFRVALYTFIASSCGMMIATTLYGAPL